MKVRLERAPGLCRFILEPEEQDILQPTEKVSLGSRTTEIQLPNQIDPDTIHPDHLALCIMMITHPFVGKSLTFPKPVSKRFGDQHNQSASRYIIGPVDDSLRPWSPRKNARPGLAFSGGVDSTAALGLMPPNTAPIFMDRPIHGKSLYDKDAAHKSCQEVKRLGYDMHIVTCDLEYVRSPVGFPVDVANSVPAVLMAEYLNLDCIGFGTIMESTYGTGHRRYRDYPHGHHYTHWGGLFRAAGLPFILPVAGISEVGTSIICNEAPIGFVAQSCMRGTWKKPCLNCWKCFRKQLLDNAILDNQLDSAYLDEIFNNREACRFLSQIPIKHENILTWSTHRLNSNHILFSLLKDRVEGTENDLTWLGKWYSPSIELIPEKYRSTICEKILQYLPKMDKGDESELTSWSMLDLIDSPRTVQNSNLLVEQMNRSIKSR